MRWFSTRTVVGFSALALLLSACAGSAGLVETSTTSQGEILGQRPTDLPPPALDAAMVAKGEILYAQYCASCHRSDLSGAPNWKTPNDAGFFPPPPHDNSGHTWHHPDELLVVLIQEGLDDVPSAMPDFVDVLTDEEILSIIEFFKSQWGEEEREFQWQVTWQGRQ